MTDLIRRSVLIDEICRSSIYKWSVEEDQAAHNWALNIINSQPSVESSKGDLISRADAIDAVHEYFRAQLAESDGEWNDELQEYVFSKEDKRLLEYNKGVNTALKALPSAEADGEDLIIKGAKGIQDGLYNIKDGKLFKYKAKGGTVRTYPILPSANAVQGEWIWRTDIPIGDGRTSAGYICSNCGKDYWHGNVFNCCPNCGARMKGGAE